MAVQVQAPLRLPRDLHRAFRVGYDWLARQIVTPGNDAEFWRKAASEIQELAEQVNHDDAAMDMLCGVYAALERYKKEEAHGQRES